MNEMKPALDFPQQEKGFISAVRKVDNGLDLMSQELCGLEEMVHRLEAMADRLLGPEPSDGSNKGLLEEQHRKGTQLDCHMDLLTNLSTRVKELHDGSLVRQLNRLDRQLSRMEKAI